jgi:hypothetical protein
VELVARFVAVVVKVGVKVGVAISVFLARANAVGGDKDNCCKSNGRGTDNNQLIGPA